MEQTIKIQGTNKEENGNGISNVWSYVIFISLIVGFVVMLLSAIILNVNNGRNIYELETHFFNEGEIVKDVRFLKFSQRDELGTGDEFNYIANVKNGILLIQYENDKVISTQKMSLEKTK